MKLHKYNPIAGSAEKWIFREVGISVNSVVEFPGAGLARLITIISELNGAI